MIIRIESITWSVHTQITIDWDEVMKSFNRKEYKKTNLKKLMNMIIELADFEDFEDLNSYIEDLSDTKRNKEVQYLWRQLLEKKNITL